MRLDRFLAAHGPFAGRGRRALASLIARGSVRVNDKPARKGTIVHGGDLVTFRVEARDAASADAAVPLMLLYVGDDVVAVDKPPGLPTTIGTSPGPSLAAALLARFPEMAALDARHAGLVHRLDTGTSGLLLAARTTAAHRRLRAAFAAKRIRKEYLAVVAGRLAAPTIVSHPLARHARSRGRMVLALRAERAWPAETEIAPIGGDDVLTLVRLHMRTGVTHQLRVHLATLGHPILGDRRYGGAAVNAAALGIAVPNWHFLHARALAFDDRDGPTRMTTPFPAHWRPLFAARGWPPPPD